MANTGAAAEGEPVVLDWPSLYARHAQELLRYVVKLVNDPEAAADIVQDTFLIGMRGQKSLRAREGARSWLYGIATNRALQLRRRRRIVQFISLSKREPASGSAYDDEAAHIRAVLQRLSTDLASALLLAFHAGFSRREIATLTGLSEEGVKSRIARGRKQFIAEYGRGAGRG